jgi:hypothetical protein
VINYSYEHRWDWPLSLKDIVFVPPELEDFFQDHKIEVTNVAWLTPEERSMLSGDFRILADTLCGIRETGMIPRDKRIIRHCEELLATLAAVTRRNYIGIRPEEIEGDQIMTMDDVLTKWEQGVFDKGEKSGFDKGEKSGFDKGEKSGFDKGEKSGFNKGQVQACQDFGKTEDETIQYLMQKYGMTLELARSTTQKYWQHSS